MTQLALHSNGIGLEATFQSVAQAARSVLQFFKSDLSLDRKELEFSFFPGAEYCLFVRQHGTHISLLGVHPMANEWTEAAVSTSEDPLATAFHVKNGRAVPIDKDRALELLNQGYAEFDGFTLRYRGLKLATYRIDSFYLESEGKSRYEVRYDSEGRKLSFEHLIVLETMAKVMVRQDSRSIFYLAPDVFLDGQDIYPQIDRMRGL